MVKFVEIFNSLIVQSLSQVRYFVAQYGPAILFSASIIIIGWICAVLMRKIITKLLRAFGFDVISVKFGFKKFLERGGIERNPSSIVGWIFYWIVLINALVMAQDALDLKVTSQFLHNIILFIPNLIVVVILLALGIYIAKFVAKFVSKAARLANIPFSNLVGNITRYVVIGVAIMMALDYVNASTAIVIDSFLILFVIVPAVIFIVLILGGKNVLVNMIDGRFLSEMLKGGDTIVVESLSGKVLSIGVVSTKLESGNEEIIIPNSELVRKIIKKKKT